MKVYWRLKDVPELAGLSWTDRIRVGRACFFRFGFGLWQFWVACLLEFVFIILGGLAASLAYAFDLPRAVSYACGLVGVLTGCLIYGWIYSTVVIDRLRPHFRDYIAERKGHV